MEDKRGKLLPFYNNADAPESYAALGALRRLTALEVDRAPAAPGIYAWYVRFPLAVDDWHPRPGDGIDEAAVDMERAVDDYARYHQETPIVLSGADDYELPWSGVLTRRSISDSIVSTPTGAAGKLTRIYDDPEQRRILLGLLHQAPPVFGSPLYVGVAKNLQKRLAEHLQDYETARINLQDQPQRSEQYHFYGKTLGERIAGASIPLSLLEVYILPAVEDGNGAGTSANERRVAEGAEWLIQRIFKPEMGRR
jgi:hypothetical protein